MKKACVCIAIVMALVLCGCTSTQGGTQGGSSGAETSTAATRHEIAHRYASASEACEIAFEIPDEVLYDNKMSRRDALDFARRATALHFYATKGVSLGYCAQIAGMDKEDFIYFLGQNGVSIFHFDDEAEFVEEMSNA